MTYIVNLHKKFGFVEESFRRQNIEENGERLRVVMQGLTKSDWLSKKYEIFKIQTANREVFNSS